MSGILTDSKAFLTLLKELLIFSGKTPKKGHSFLLTAMSRWREIDRVTGSELPREGDGRAAIDRPDFLERAWRELFSNPRGRMPGS
ncbi:hypothetical protein [Mesorhizobium captivum]|uniref:hypothetical protein n=1 Tax=Mesorhizobium captivum TaxID=3072319 RepID=UPI002A245909|nr:hypothetical protein [Mesorhizobium sp. VK22B]MDX8509069.1 hypothetical protein [Mesorhizobium sp. VK22E]